MRPNLYRDVPIPARTDGVGEALRQAFRPEGEAEPFGDLLRRMDK